MSADATTGAGTWFLNQPFEDEANDAVADLVLARDVVAHRHRLGKVLGWRSDRSRPNPDPPVALPASAASTVTASLQPRSRRPVSPAAAA
jgi:hypothetical protein